MVSRLARATGGPACGLAIVLVLFGVTQSARAAERIVATFDVVHSGATVGAVEWDIRRGDDGSVEFRTVNNTVGLAKLIRDITIVQHSRGIFRAGDYRSDYYLYERRGDKRAGKVEARFDWVAGEVNIHRTAADRDETRAEPLGEPLTDELGHVLALGAALAAGDKSPGFRILRRDKVRHYRYAFEGEERLTTPIGEVDTLRLKRQRDNGKRETTIWSAPAINYLPVRIAHREKDRRIEILLRTWSNEKQSN